MTHTKEDYRNALESFERNLRAYDYEPDIEAILTLKNCEVIKSALQLAIDLQPRPIEEAPRNKLVLVGDGLAHMDSRGTWYSDVTTRELQYLPDYFYDLSALPKPGDKS